MSQGEKLEAVSLADLGIIEELLKTEMIPFAD